MDETANKTTPTTGTFDGLVVESGPRRRPAEPQIVGSNPTQPANTHPCFYFGSRSTPLEVAF
jgi:hypothetical protein